MVAAKRRVRSHRFNGTTVCQDCRLEMDADIWLADMPGCPGPRFRLIYVGRRV